MPRIKQCKSDYLVNDFPHWIEDSLREKEMKQKELAFLLGISQQTLSYKMRNYTFTFEDFIKIVEIFKPDEKQVIRLVKSWE